LLPQRHTKIDDLTRPNHKYLEADDRCYFLGEYTSGAGFSTPTNDLIFNFKIPPTELKKNPRRQRWKDAAINDIARALGRNLSGLKAGRIVVPIPPSKLPGHPDYDDRLLRTVALAKATPGLSVRELIKQRESTSADHESDHRQSFEELLANSYLDEGVALPAPTGIVLVDDVLTEGKHFKVCQHLIRARYGNEIPIAGFFVARRIYQAADFDFDEFFAE
jgi:hypothetical protein